MEEKDRYFAIIPIHERAVLVEGQTIDELKEGIGKVLKRPEQSYPFHDFRAEMTVIKGRKIELPK